MKSSVAITLGSAVLAVLLGAYLVASATTVRDPVPWRNGDLVVQDASVGQALPVFENDGTGLSHIGIVEKRPDGVFVIETVDAVRETPMKEFVARGKNRDFAVYRVNDLDEKQAAAVVAAAKRQLGKPADMFLRRNWEELYSSELVKLAYNDIGVDLGRTQRIGTIGKDTTPVKAQFGRNWSTNPDCRRRNLDKAQCWALVQKQDVVTPSAIVNDGKATKIYSTK